jgi:Ca2+-binding EF-hand superfamily protein
MIFFILYIFALAATSLIGRSMDDDEFAQEMFGTVPLSMFTLFQIMTLDSWTAVVRPIGDKQSWTYVFFLGFIAISVFVLVNLITAVIVENAFESSKADEQDMAVVMQREKEREVEELRDLFLECDQDGSGELTKDEFYEAIAKPKIKQKLNFLEIQTSEVNELWDILDDGDGRLSAEEFTGGLRKLKGESKAKDVMGVLHEVKKMEDGVTRMEDAAYDISENLIDARIGVGRLHDDISAVWRTVKKVNLALAAAAAVQGTKEPQRPASSADSY